jgi:hypothetical protein
MTRTTGVRMCRIGLSRRRATLAFTIALLCSAHPALAAEELPAWLRTINSIQESGLGSWISQNVRNLDSLTKAPRLGENLYGLGTDQLKIIEDVGRTGRLDEDASTRSFNLRMKDIIRDGGLPSPIGAVIESIESTSDKAQASAKRIAEAVDRVDAEVSRYAASARATLGFDLSTTVDLSDEERRSVLTSQSVEQHGLPDAAISEVLEFERVRENLEPEQIYFRDPTNDNYFEQRAATYVEHQRELQTEVIAGAEETGSQCYEIMPGWSVQRAANAVGFVTCGGRASAGAATRQWAATASTGEESTTVIRRVGDQECRNVALGKWNAIVCGDSSTRDPGAESAGGDVLSDLDRELQAMVDAEADELLQSVKNARAQGISDSIDSSVAWKEALGRFGEVGELATRSGGSDVSACRGLSTRFDINHCEEYRQCARLQMHAYEENLRQNREALRHLSPQDQAAYRRTMDMAMNAMRDTIAAPCAQMQAVIERHTALALQEAARQGLSGEVEEHLRGGGYFGAPTGSTSRSTPPARSPGSGDNCVSTGGAVCGSR